MVSEGDECFRALVADLKHDLGKYVAWRSANYPELWAGDWDERAWNEPEWVEALRSDILTTLGGRAAWEIWDERTSGWPRPWASRAMAQVEQAVEVLRRHGDLLRAGASVELVRAHRDLVAAQRTIRDALRRAAREAQSE